MKTMKEIFNIFKNKYPDNSREFAKINRIESTWGGIPEKEKHGFWNMFTIQSLGHIINDIEKAWRLYLGGEHKKKMDEWDSVGNFVEKYNQDHSQTFKLYKFEDREESPDFHYINDSGDLLAIEQTSVNHREGRNICLYEDLAKVRNDIQKRINKKAKPASFTNAMNNSTKVLVMDFGHYHGINFKELESLINSTLFDVPEMIDECYIMGYWPPEIKYLEVKREEGKP